MAISPTSTSSQSSSDQAPPASSTGAHRRYQVSNRKSERPPAVTENESFARMPGFFERIANRFKKWKKNRSQAAVNKSAETAGSDILNGLRDNNFKKVHQGLKRLHNAARKLSDMGARNERHYIKEKLERVIYDLHVHIHKLKSDDPEVPIILDDYDEGRNELIDRYSDKRTLFHRMLTNLDKVGLISSSYVRSRTQRIDDLDVRIKASLESLKVLWKEDTPVYLLEEKVKAGDPYAIFLLGRYYYNGKGGVRQDQAKAIDLWQEAKNYGNTDAMVELGRCYFHGRGGVHQDEGRAIDLWEEAAKAKNADAMVLLGRCYFHGLGGVDKDQVRAIGLWQEAVKAENPEAMYELGCRYYNGLGVGGMDEDKAIDLWQRAAARGHAEAKVMLAVCGRADLAVCSQSG